MNVRRQFARRAAAVMLFLIGWSFGPLTAAPQERPTSLGVSQSSDVTAAQIEKLKVLLNHDLSPIGRTDSVSIVVMDAQSGKTLFDRSGKEALIPASNTKIFTAAAALAVLGQDYPFETKIGGTTPLLNGVVDGDLVIFGTGDPTVNERFVGQKPMLAMMALAQRLVDAGLKKVTGRIVADTSFFSGPATGESWPQEPSWKYWMVEASPLVFNDNHVELKASVVDGRVVVGVDPDFGFVKVSHQLQIVSEKRNEGIGLVRSADGRSFTLTGKIWSKTVGAEIRANVGDGALYFAAALHAALREKGVDVSNDIATSDAPIALDDSRVLLTYRARLMDFLPIMMQQSNNLYAELIFRMLGSRLANEGSFHGGWRALFQWLAKEEIYEKSTQLADGSGLSRANKASALQIARVLHRMWTKTDVRDVFRTSMAQPGAEGTLGRRLPALKGKLFAKTGTLNDVSSLSGYVQARSGRWFVFSLLFNDNRGYARRVQDHICTTLAGIDF
jgi:D-alanyl-D-alanine carboxypeptidase/D-alanyl-D-alanine-endopeptidase (penicillin-binding protein 4)